MLAQLRRDFSASSALPCEAAAATVFDGLVAQGVRIGRMDFLIASIALLHGMVFVTSQARDFGKVPELRIESWMT